MSPISVDTSIRYLFLNGCKATEENISYWLAIDNIVELCGTKCLLPDICSNWLSSSPVRDYSVKEEGNSLVDNSPEMEALKNKTKVTRLSLKGNNLLTNSYLEEVLSTLTGMEYLQLNGCSLLATCNFVKNMPNLKELDIRGTNLIDLTVLNTEVTSKKITKLQTLLIDNTRTDMKSLQDVINLLYDANQKHDYNSWVNPNYILCRGLCLEGDGYDFSKCDKILKFYSSYDFDSGVIDLTGCVNLSEFSCCRSARTYKLGGNLTIYNVRDRDGIDDLSAVISISKTTTDEMSNSYLGGSLESLTDNATLNEIILKRWKNYDFNFISSINSNVRDKIKKIDIPEDGWSSVSIITDISKISLLTNLKECILKRLDITDLSPLSGLELLTSLTISHSEIDDWSGLPTTNLLDDQNLSIEITDSNLNSLSFLKGENSKITSLSIKNCKLSRLSEIGNLKNIESLDFTGNFISDLSSLSSLLNKEDGQKTSLQSLILDSNPIGDGCLFQENNIEILKKLKTTGVSTISINNCGLGDLKL